MLAGQVASGRQGAFLHARGEQFLEVVRQADYLRDYLGHEVDPAKLTFSDRFDAAMAMVRRTGPQLLDLLVPKLSLPKPAESVRSVPPVLALYAAPLAPFVLWGLILSVRAARRRPGHLLLLGWPIATNSPVLLTTRFDGHRMAIVSIPLALWAVAGLLGAVDLLATRRVLRAMRVPLALVLLGATGVSALRPVFVPRAKPDPFAGLLVEAARGDRPVIFGVCEDHAAVGWAQLTLLDRLRFRPGLPGLALEERLLQGLGAAAELQGRPAVRAVEAQVLDEADVVLAPDSELSAAGRVLSAKGRGHTRGRLPRPER